MREAWSDADVEQVNASLLRPRHAAHPAPSPRGVAPSGLADFHGFPLTRMEGVHIADADFTAARPPKNAFGVAQSVHVLDVTADRVVFDRAGPFHRLHGAFSACTFRRISTRHGSLVGSFSDCDFTGANFNGAHFAARFLRCRFVDCRMHLASWGGEFDDCEFAGSSIHEIFHDIRDLALAAERVSFVVTARGARRTGPAPGEAGAP